MKFRNWMLQLPDGTETGPFDFHEIRDLLPKESDLLARTCIRSTRERAWSSLARHPQCGLFLTDEQQAATLQHILPPDPPPALLKRSRKGPVPQATNQGPSRRERIRRQDLSFASVQEMLDFNAVCAGQELVRDRIRHRPRKYRPRSRVLEFVSGVCLYNALLFVLCYAITVLIAWMGFLEADGTLPVLALHVLLNNPISVVSLVAGASFITMSLFWLIFVMR